MSGRFVSDLLDLSRLPAPEALRGFNYEAVLAERRARLVVLLDEAGIPYDAQTLNTDPGMVLQQADTERELFQVAAINEAVRSVLLAFAGGASLDHLASLFGVVRLDGELDASLRRRVHLAPDAYGAAGSEGAYVYWARTADVRVSDAVALGPSIGGLKPGQVHVVIATDAADPAAVLDVVTRKLFSREVKPLTDMLTVRLAKPLRFDVEATIEIPRGPDPSVVLAAARAALNAYLEKQRRIGALIAWTGIAAAIHVAAAERVEIASPTGDIDPGPDGLALIRTIDLQTRIVGA